MQQRQEDLDGTNVISRGDSTQRQRAEQNFIFGREPHEFQERFTLANGRCIETINPLPAFDGTSVGETLVFVLAG